ncbi:AAA family ATPase [Sphingopyxis sp. J-6]|uniref:ATP-dependent nuclease n=1 Tax=Sphingopyxis sp. J-6 TaxID=3122054 RepID=UPI003983F16E
MQHYVRVEFERFKAFKKFSLNLRQFNILVGPNNAGKSTILSAFRILSAAFRRAESKRATLVHTSRGTVMAHAVDMSDISVASENVFYNYIDDEPATVKFHLSDGKSLSLYFPEREVCYLIPDANGATCESPSQFRNHFDCPIGFVPILGPVDHHERLYEKEAARRALFNYQAARNFRNIWHHYPEHFDEFRDAIRSTWPGMDIQRPEIDTSYERARINMFCPEGRIPREIFWSGFGFQVWAQMLTHVIQSRSSSIFLIDEPDIYLHSDLQRQLVGMLRSLGPDVLIATHSTEIITEAEADEIVVVNKSKIKSNRIKNSSQLEAVFQSLGSNVNPILTQLGKTKKAIFVEGKDFQVISKFARKMDSLSVANRSSFAVVPIEGFNPERAKNLKAGMELTLGLSVSAAIMLDRDYRSDAECSAIKAQCKDFSAFTHIHKRKEIENFLLVPSAIDRAVAKRIADRATRTGEMVEYSHSATEILLKFSSDQKSYIAGQHLTLYRKFQKSINPLAHEEAITQQAYEWLDKQWEDEQSRICLLPGKDALSALNTVFQENYKVSVTATGIIDALTNQEIPAEIKSIIRQIEEFVG